MTKTAPSPDYSGPEFCSVIALDEWHWEVRTNVGERIGIYPTVRIAIRVAKNAEKIFLRDYLKAMRKPKSVGK